MIDGLQIAVLVPCFNEEATITRVVNDFAHHIPGADIYVYDNNSTDRTRAAAAAAGAIVKTEPRQGKGNVVRRMFSDIEADIYVLADGDATYDAASSGRMITTMIDGNMDMVVGVRRPVDAARAYRAGHRFGNRVLTGTVSRLFGRNFTDMLSGFRVMSRRFVKSFPVRSTGFEIETEISVHALYLGMPVGEVATDYFERPAGSESKLNTWQDGFRILWKIFVLTKDFRPLAFFGWIAVILAGSSVLMSLPLLSTYMETGLVQRLPTAILVTGMMLVACLSAVCGVILDSVNNAGLEAKRLAYLNTPLTPGNGKNPE